MHLANQEDNLCCCVSCVSHVIVCDNKLFTVCNDRCLLLYVLIIVEAIIWYTKKSRESWSRKSKKDR